MMNRFKVLFVILSLACVPAVYAGADAKIQSSKVQATKEKEVTIALVTVGASNNAQLKSIVSVVKDDLTHSGQCKAISKSLPELKKSSEVADLYSKDGCSLAFFISEHDDEVLWRLYDTAKVVMIQGKACRRQNADLRRFAHQLADQMWAHFMGSLSCFASKIAWCEGQTVVKNGKKRDYKYIYTADWDGHNVTQLVDDPTISLAPRWNHDLTTPLLYFSQNTASNVRLMLANMYGAQMEICSFEGLNMLPAFSADGKDMVICLSKDGSAQLYHVDRHSKKVKMHRLTHNEGNNISPCFMKGSTIAFASDMRTKWPQIYTLNIKTGVTEQLTDKGYCACPNYCAANNKLVYSKMMQGKMQLFVYDCATKIHKQVTFDTKESKEEGCWSPCGTYIMYVADSNAKGRIARLNMITGKTEYLTPESKDCSYPAWSPLYVTCVGS